MANKKLSHQMQSFLNKKTFFFSVLALFILGIAGTTTGAQFEDHDPFCASCHTQPENTYLDRSARPKVDLASAHAHEDVRCIDCHSGEGLSGRAKAMALGARDAVVFLSGNYPQPAPQTRPIEDANCLKCHSEVFNTSNFNKHFHVFLPRWQAIDSQAATCVDCHQSHTTDGEPSLGFLNEPVTAAVCQDCHRAAGEGD